MALKCRFCKSTRDLKTLTRNELKVTKCKFPDAKADDIFCSTCRERIHGYLLKTVDKNKRKRERTESSVLTTYSSDNSIRDISPVSKRPRGNNADSTKTNTSSTNLRHSPRSASQNTSQFSPEIILFQPPSQIPSNIVSSSETSSEETNQPPPIVPTDLIHREESDESSSDESVPVWVEVPGSAAINNVQPFIRRRRDSPVFPNDRDVPIYNRSNFGG